MASSAYPGPPPPRGHHHQGGPPPHGPPPPGGSGMIPSGLTSPAAPVPPPTKRHRASDSPATMSQQQQSAAAHAHGGGPPPSSSSLHAPPPQRGYVQQGYYPQQQQQQQQQAVGCPAHPPPAQTTAQAQTHAGPSAMDTSSPGTSQPLAAGSPSLASPAVDEAIARRRAELRRLQALRQHPTPKAPPRGSAGGAGTGVDGGDALSEMRSHLADRRSLPSASGGGIGRIAGRDAAPLRSRDGPSGGLLPGPPPDRSVGARRTSSLYGRGALSSEVGEASGDGFGDDGTASSAGTAAAAPPASKPSHPPLTKRPSPPPPSSGGKPRRSSSAPPRRLPVPPPRGGPAAPPMATTAAPDGHHATAGIVTTTSSGGGGKPPQPPPPRVSFGHPGTGTSMASPPNNSNAVGVVGGAGVGIGEVGGPSPPAARRLNLSPLDKQPQQPPMASNEPPRLESEPSAVSSPSSSGPPPPVTTPFGGGGVTDTIRKADRVLQDDIPTPRSRTGYTPDGGSAMSGLTNDNNMMMTSPPPPTMPSFATGTGTGGGSTRSTSSHSTANSTASRKEVLTSMFLGADSPAVKSNSDAGEGVGPQPQDGRPQQQQQESTELRLIKELRKTKEDNVQNLRQVTRLEAEVSTLRSGSTGSGSGTHIPALSGLMGAPTGRSSSADLETLVQVAREDGESKAIQWASTRLEQQKHSRSSTSLNSIGFSSPTPSIGMMMSPLTSPRERGTMTDAGVGGGEGSGGTVGVGTPGMRKRILTPHPRRRRPAAGKDDEGAFADPERDLLVKAAESIPHEFVSDLATYYVRVPYVSSQPDDAATPGSSDPWELHGVEASSRFYADVADANRPATVEVMARIVSDGSVAVLHEACSFRHETAGGNGSNDFRNVDAMDGPLGCVMYIDVDGTEREYWLDAIYEEAQATRDAYCSSLLSAASALKAAAPSLAAVTAAAAASSGPPMNAPPALMPPSQFPAPMQPLESLPPQTSPTSDACVGTEEISFPPAEQTKQAKPEAKPTKKTPSPVEFEDDGSGSTDALSMMLGFIFETVFGIIYFFLIGLPVRVIKYSIILVVLYVTLATTWLYLADDNGAMDMGAMVNFGAYQQSLW